MSDVLYRHCQAYLRAKEAHKEAWQMALDLNQPADVRREWEQKRDAAASECNRLVFVINFPHTAELTARETKGNL